MDDIKPPILAGSHKNEFEIEEVQPVTLPPEHTDPVPKKTEPFKPPKPRKKFKFLPYFDHTKLSKKQKILGICLIVLLLAGAVWGGMAIYKHFHQPSKTSATVAKEAAPTTEPSRLTGLPVKPKYNKRPITGVMIENSPDARPQSGLIDAGVVVEAIAEGGITRFFAMYQEAQPSYIGPVRSARPYYLDFALAFQSSVAHVGGSPDALRQINALHVRNLDEFANAGAFWRVNSRYAPHNVYTSMAKLDQLSKSKGFKSSDFTSWQRKPDRPSKVPEARTINLSISSFYYNVRYNFDAKKNCYKRSEGGKPHVDERSKKQLCPKVVIAPVMNYGILSDGKHSHYTTTGKGTAFIFQDGQVVKGTWQKKSRSSQIFFVDSKGQTIRLNAGQTWLSLVGSAGDVSYKP